MSFNPYSEPDPSGSPLEKLKISRRTPAPKDLLGYLIREGVDSDLAGKLARAVKQWEHEMDFDNLESVIDLEMWANRHTHPGSGGGGGIPLPVEVLGADWDASAESYSDQEVISEIHDASDALNHLINASGAGSSIWDADVVNGNPGYSFNPSRRISGALSVSIPQPYTVVCVGVLNSVSGYVHILGGSQGSGEGQIYISSGTLRTQASGFDTWGADENDLLNPFILSVVFNEISSYGRLNGAEEPLELGTGPISSMYLGQDANGSGDLSGSFGRVLLFDDDIRASGDLDTLEENLSSLYGIPIA